MRPTGIIDTENHRIERTNYKNVEFRELLKTRLSESNMSEHKWRMTYYP